MVKLIFRFASTMGIYKLFYNELVNVQLNINSYQLIKEIKRPTLMHAIYIKIYLVHNL